MSSFSDLGVPAPFCRVLGAAGITTPTPIQSASLPDALVGRDVLGRGRTGSGKTLAFVLPVVSRLTESASAHPRVDNRSPRALILAPTRELAAQIDTVLRPYADAAGLRTQTVYGGVSQHSQVAALRRGVDVVIACPGRLEDLIAQGHCSLARVRVTVLDEADHMADLGFLPAVRRLLDRTPKDGQRLLFSATLDRAVDAIARRYLTNPAVHSADPTTSPNAHTTHHMLQIRSEDRVAVVCGLTSAASRSVVFTRTKHGAKSLARQLNRAGVRAVELHGNLSQNARARSLGEFTDGTASTLVATDIAARGIHVDDVALVIHADLPGDHKAYVHRSGRTARAGARGLVVTLATAEQQREVRALARAAGITPKSTIIRSATDDALTTIVTGPRATPRNARVPAIDHGTRAPVSRLGSSRRRRRPGPKVAAQRARTQAT